MHWMPCALSLPLPRTGRSSEAKMAMIAITTSNSIRVKPAGKLGGRRPAHGPRQAPWAIKELGLLENRPIIKLIFGTVRARAWLGKPEVKGFLGFLREKRSYNTRL